jgi:hypothetical protein
MQKLNLNPTQIIQNKVTNTNTTNVNPNINININVKPTTSGLKNKLEKNTSKINTAIHKIKKNISSRYPENTKSLEWEYLKKSIEGGGVCDKIILNDDDFIDSDIISSPFNFNDKLISEDFMRLDEINSRLVNDEDNIINTHMNIIKDDAKLLTEEGELISNVKGVGKVNFEMDQYASRLENIINKKIAIYLDLKKKMEIYK